MWDRDQKREQWRLAAHAWVVADDLASRAEEGRSILLAELINTLLQQNPKLPKTDADRMARTSQAFRRHVDEMHNLRRHANELKIEMLNLDRIYWQGVSEEATSRAERRMG